MNHDEVVRGNDEADSRSNGWLFIVGIAVLAAVVSLLGHHSQSTAIAPLPVPKPLPAPSVSTVPSAGTAPSISTEPSAAPSASAPPSAGTGTSPAGHTDPTAAVLAQISGYVSVDAVCQPLTDGRTTLTVRFLLRNVTALSEQLIRVTPELPLGGLRPRGSAVQSGTCEHPTGKAAPPAKNPLPVGGSLIVSLHFALPKTCPAPYPVQAVVTVGIAGAQRTDTVALYTDLGGVPFDLCKTRAAG